MKNVDLNILKEASLRLMFEMSETEYKTLLDEFEILKQQIDILSKIKDVDNAIPMTFPFLMKKEYLREDIPCESLTKEEIFKNAPSVENDYIKIPKVVK